MEHKDYIPQNTNDIMAVERLKQLPFEAVRKDIPALLEWLQDGHWPVADGITQYLMPHINEITQELVFVLNTDDSMWKYFIIYGLIARSPDKLSSDLIKALRKNSEHPSNIDIENTVDEAAKDIISNKALCG
jgi:hypothetical protein